MNREFINQQQYAKLYFMFFTYVYKKLEDSMITHTGLLKTILNGFCCEGNQ